MDNNDSEEPNVKKRKTNKHNSTTFKSTDAGNNLLSIDSLDNGIVIRFASYLCPRDLISLALTCHRFGGSADGLSLMEDTARQIICNAIQEERDALPKLTNQTYIEVYNELLKHREPRVFDQLIGNRLSYVDNDKSHMKFVGEATPNAAICNHVMRAGRHYATFTSGGDAALLLKYVGITRPLPNWDKKGLTSFFLEDPDNFEEFQRERTERWSGDVNYCGITLCNHVALTYDWGSWRPNGLIGAAGMIGDGSHCCISGDKIGLLLDLDAGTLTIYKNGERLGTAKDGLAGEYCWFGTLASPGNELCIEKESIPL